MLAATDILSEKNCIEEYLSMANRSLATDSFINIYSWSHHYDFECEVIDKSLCVFATDEMGTFLYLPPLSKTFNKSVYETCFDVIEERNKCVGVGRIENADFKIYCALEGDKFKFEKKGHECIYFKKDIVELKGNAYKSKRASFNAFTRNNNYEYISFEGHMITECMELFDAWTNQRTKKNQDDVYHAMLQDNREVHLKLMDHYNELGLIGRVISVDGKIVAYTFGYHLNDNTFCICLEVANLDIAGVSVGIFQRFCADDALGKYKFINVMDSIGLPNIEQTKMLFRPTVMIPSFTLQRIGP